MKETMFDLLKKYPTMSHPIRCENGCGAVVELVDAFESYKRDEDGNTLLICECCAAEEGHRNEDIEDPEDAPVCKRKPKVKP